MKAFWKNKEHEHPLKRTTQFLNGMISATDWTGGSRKTQSLTENHFHLVATTPEGNLSKWMHSVEDRVQGLL